MLNLTETLSTAEWISQRSEPESAFKLKNVNYIDQFNELIKSRKDKYDGTIRCYNKPPAYGRYIKYGEGTPIFHLFKFVPQEVFVTEFDIKEYWDGYRINEDAIQRFYTYELNKYEQPEVKSQLDVDDYVLYVAASDYRFDLVFLIQAIKWSVANKKYLVIKKHPYTFDNFDYKILLNRIANTGVSLDYVRLVEEANTSVLVDHCSMLWTPGSGVGLQAILKNKPVSYFCRYTDYMYGPIANFCSTPEEAYTAVVPDKIKVYSYLSWYYDKMSIDLCNDKCSEMLDEKLYNYFVLKQSVDEYLSGRN